MSEKPIKTPVTFNDETRMILDGDGNMVCHFMWNTHRPHWNKVNETARLICDLINENYDAVAELEAENERLRKAAAGKAI